MAATATLMGAVSGSDPLPRQQMDDTPFSVQLSGTPTEIGTLWGQISREAIQHDIEHYYLIPANEKGMEREALIRRSARFIETVRDFSPHWLEETDAIAVAAGIDQELYQSFVGSVYRAIWAGDECTSYAVPTQHTKDAGIFFHKNRDNQPKRQCAFILQQNAPGLNKFISVSDASVLSCMMMVNEKGLAGSADMGGLEVGTPRYRGWMNTAVLRYIAEQASDCEDALRIVTQFVQEGVYAGGGKVGTHWLFVDVKGRILEISNNSTEVEHQYHADDVYFSIHRGGAVAALADAPRPIDFATFHNASRHPETCFQTSVSGMSVWIDRAHPELFTQAWISMPARALSLPLVIGGTYTPLAMLNGDADIAARKDTRASETWEPIERLAFAHQDHVFYQAREALAGGDPELAAGILDGWTEATAKAFFSTVSR